MTALAMVLALAIDAAFGWPGWLYQRIGHPVTWIGALIQRLDVAWNRASTARLTQRWAGVLAALMVIGISVGVGLGLQLLLPAGLWGLVLTAVLAAPLLAARSLDTHVRAVADPLGRGDLERARRAVSHIVGRDTEVLDTAGMARAALESLGENASDGVVAPLFWGALFGLPGLYGYKAINTLDSMIGYKTERHEDFGRFAARLDDLVNWVPARLTALSFALVSGALLRVWRVCRQDAPHHRSPNGGWPEAALAASLGCRVSGPRVYGDRTETQPWVNAEAPDPKPQDLRRGLAAYWRMLMLVGVVTLAVGFWAGV